MVGEDTGAAPGRRKLASTATDVEVLRLDGVSGAPPGGRPLVDVTFAVRAGEVLGVAGVEGNGQRELSAALTGAWRPDVGTVTVNERPLSEYTPAQRSKLIADVPDDQALAVVDRLSVWQNIALSRMAWADGPAPPRSRRLRREAAALVREFQIRTPSVDAPINQLSGGNRQRVILARELSKNPAVVILCFATKGLDVRSAEQVRDWVLQAARGRTAVVYISAELDEVLDISDRIAVMAGGRVAGILTAADASIDEIGALMLQASTTPASFVADAD